MSDVVNKEALLAVVPDEALKARIDFLMADRKHILQERDRSFALMLERIEKSEAAQVKLREVLTRIRDYCGHSPTTQAELNCAAWAEAALAQAVK